MSYIKLIYIQLIVVSSIVAVGSVLVPAKVVVISSVVVTGSTLVISDLVVAVENDEGVLVFAIFVVVSIGILVVVVSFVVDGIATVEDV